MNKKIINRYEIRIWTARRSGHHAVINWLASMFMLKEAIYNKVFFHNNVAMGTNPYMKNPSLRGNELSKFFWPVWDIKNKEDAVNFFPRIYKDCVIYNHENASIKKGVEGIYSDDVLGKSDKKFDVLVVRSFENQLASILKSVKEEDRYKRERLINRINRVYNPLYHTNILEFLGETNYLPLTKALIFFDLWVSSKAYREKKAEEMGLVNNDYTLNYMANYRNRGSSFEDLNIYYNKAKEMKVLERYKEFSDDLDYNKIMQENYLLIKLSKEAFNNEKNLPI